MNYLDKILENLCFHPDIVYLDDFSYFWYNLTEISRVIFCQMNANRRVLHPKSENNIPRLEPEPDKMVLATSNTNSGLKRLIFPM